MNDFSSKALLGAMADAIKEERVRQNQQAQALIAQQKEFQAELIEKVEQTQARLDEATRALSDARAEDRDALEAKQAEVAAQLSGALATYTEVVEKITESLVENVGEQESRLETIGKRLDELRQAHDELASVEPYDDAPVRRSITALNEAFDGNRKQYEQALREQKAWVEEQLGLIPERYDDTELRKEVESRFEAYRSAATHQAEATQRQLNDVIDRVTEQVEELRKAIPEGFDPAPIYARLDQVSKTLDDIELLSGETETATAGRIDQLKNELGAQIKGLAKTIPDEYDDTELRNQLSSVTDMLLEVYEREDPTPSIRKDFADVSRHVADLEKSQAHGLELIEQRLLTKIAEVRKEPGPQGEPGERGPEGKPADPEEVAAILVKDFGEKLRGEKGKRGPVGLGLEAEPWKPDTIYIPGEMVQYGFGKFARAINRTNTRPSNRKDWERVGHHGFEFHGYLKEQDRKNLENGDIYLDDGTAFIFWNGKGRMLAQRGRDGLRGPPGEDGRPGRDAAELAGAEVIQSEKQLYFIRDDGTSFEVDLSPWWKATADLVEQTVRKEVWSQIEEREREDAQRGVPLKVFRSRFNRALAYRAGDVVLHGGYTYVARTAVNANRDFRLEDWALLTETIGAGGGGSGGINPNTLPNAAPLTGDDQLVVLQGGVAKKAPADHALMVRHVSDQINAGVLIVELDGNAHTVQVTEDVTTFELDPGLNPDFTYQYGVEIHFEPPTTGGPFTVALPSNWEYYVEQGGALQSEFTMEVGGKPRLFHANTSPTGVVRYSIIEAENTGTV